MPSHRTFILIFALVAPVLAGCVSPAAIDDAADAGGDPVAQAAAIAGQLSQKLGDLPIVHSIVDVETRHGLVNVDLYLPETPNAEKVPVILVASPYNNANSPLALAGGGKDGSNENWIDLRLYNWIREELMPRGYAFAQMDILGTRNSGGCMGIMNAAERQATADVVDWLGTQDWSTGKVGMIGKSYLGLSQLGAAVENPEHLAAIVPISPPTHDYAYHYYQGVPYALNHATNVLYYGAYSLPPPDADGAAVADYAARYPERAPCAPEAIAGGAYTLGDYSERWQERDYRPLIPQMRDDIAVFFIAGHQDWNVKPDHVLDVYNQVPGPKTLLVGQWAHDYPNINNWDDEAFGEREDWYFTLHRWFDHHLKGIDTGLMQENEACPVQTQGSDAAWRCLNAFPPLPERFDDAATGAPTDSGDGVSWRALHPQPDGTLGDAPGSGTAEYQDAARTGMGTATGAGAPGTAKFAWEAPERLRFAGAPEVTMRVETTSAFNTFLVAALAVERDGALHEFTWAFQSLRHRDDLASPSLVEPATPYDVRFRFYPVDHVLEPGEKLVLVLRGDADGPNGGILKNQTPGVQTLHLDATALHLPLVPLDRGFTPLLAAQLPDAYPAEEDA